MVIAGEPAGNCLRNVLCVLLCVGNRHDIVAFAVVDVDARQWGQMRGEVGGKREVETLPVGIKAPKRHGDEEQPRDRHRAGLFRQQFKQNGAAERVGR